MEQHGSIIQSIRYLTQSFVAPHIDFLVYKIIYILKGRIRITFQNQTLEAGTGSLIFFNNFEPHTIDILQTPFERYLVTLLPEEVDWAIKDPRLLVLFKKPITRSNIFNVADSGMPAERFFSDLLYEAEHNDEFSNLSAGCSLYHLMIRLYREHHEIFPAQTLENIDHIYSIQKYIDSHFAEKITIGELCDRFYISSSYLTHCFKKQTGYSPMQYLKLIRLSYAKMLLSGTDFNISQIAEKSGFGDVNNFIKAFKEHFHKPPGILRREERNSDRSSTFS